MRVAIGINTPARRAVAAPVNADGEAAGGLGEAGNTIAVGTDGASHYPQCRAAGGTGIAVNCCPADAVTLSENGVGRCAGVGVLSK